jgi:transformation/transcription domain-associated protein
MQSLKVLAELPILVVLLYQIHKTQVQSEIADFIPLILTMVNLAPTREQRAHANFNRDLYVEFMSAQVKALSFLAFLTRLFHVRDPLPCKTCHVQDMVLVHANALVQGIMQLLESCPAEVVHQRRELIMATRHLLSSELRNKFIPQLARLFDEKLVIGTGWTANDALRWERRERERGLAGRSCSRCWRTSCTTCEPNSPTSNSAGASSLPS